LTSHRPLSKTNQLGGISPTAEPYHDFEDNDSFINYLGFTTKKHIQTDIIIQFSNTQGSEVCVIVNVISKPTGGHLQNESKELRKRSIGMIS